MCDQPAKFFFTVGVLDAGASSGRKGPSLSSRCFVVPAARIDMRRGEDHRELSEAEHLRICSCRTILACHCSKTATLRSYMANEAFIRTDVSIDFPFLLTMPSWRSFWPAFTASGEIETELLLFCFYPSSRHALPGIHTTHTAKESLPSTVEVEMRKSLHRTRAPGRVAFVSAT